MKPALVVAAVLFSLSTQVMADIVMPSDVIIEGDAANQVGTKMVEVTGQKPSKWHGGVVVAAKASITCSGAPGGAAYQACRITFDKSN